MAGSRALPALAGGIIVVVLAATGSRGAGPPDIPPIPLLDIRRDGGSSIYFKVAVSECGLLIAFFSTEKRRGWEDQVEVWSVHAGRCLFVENVHRVTAWPPDRSILQFAPDGRSLVVGSTQEDKHSRVPQTTVRVFEVPSGKLVTKHRLPDDIGMHGVLLRDGKTLVASSQFEAAVLYDTTTWKRVGVFKGEEKMPGTSANPEPGKPLPYDPKRLENHTRQMVLSPDGKWLAIGTEGGWLSVWDIEKQKRLWRKRVSDQLMRCLSFSYDGGTLASQEGNVRGAPHAFWKRRDGTAIMDVARRSSKFSAYLPDGDMIVDRPNRPGFRRWDPINDELKGPDWGDVTGTGDEKSPNRLRLISDPEGMAVSRNGKTVVLVTPIKEGRRVSVYDLTKMYRDK